MRHYIGWDNGVSGTIGIIGEDVSFFSTPIKRCLNYQKEASYINRLDVEELYLLLGGFEDVFVLLERPMVNPKMFKSSTSALRCFEASLVVLETLRYPYEVIDSKVWQGFMLPNGVKGDASKFASLEVGNRLFPQFTSHKHPDRDGLLMAEFGRRKNY